MRSPRLNRVFRRDPIGGGGGGFRPTDVTSATKRSWHRGDLGIVPGTGVQTWVDQFGNGYDVAQATGSKQPTLTALAGKAALNFASASAQVLNLTDAARCNALAGGSDAAYTVYLVLSAVSLPTSPIPFGLGSSASSTTFADTYIVAGDSGIHYERRDGVGASADATMIGGAFALNTPYLMRIRFSGTAVSIILNGVTLFAGSALDVGSLSLDRFSIGASTRVAAGGLAGTFWNGPIAEVITYSGLVSEAEEARLVAEYFRPRYGASVGSDGVGVQSAGARIGAFSAANHFAGPAGNGPDEQNSRTFICAFWRALGTNGAQHIWGFNTGSTGWTLEAGSTHELRLFHKGASSTYFSECYLGLNVVAWTKTSGGVLRWSLNGSVARVLTSPGAYTNGGGSAVHAIGYNAGEASSPADQCSMLWNAVIDAELTDADLQTISSQANALDRWHAPALVTGHAALRWLANWEDWDGAASSFAGSGSSPYTLTRVGTGGGRSVMRGYRRYQVPANAVWDSVEAFSQGITGRVGLRRGAYAQTRFTTSAEDAANNGPGGLIVDTLTSTWNVAAWPGQIQAGVNVSGSNLQANLNGLVPTPGILQVEGYGLERAIDCPGVVTGSNKPVILTDGMQTTTGAGVGSAATVLAVRVPDTDSITWTTRVVPSAQAIFVFDSKGGQTEGLTNDAYSPAQNPSTLAWPMLARANAGSMRVACEGRGSGTWNQRIATANARTAFVETLRQLAIGSASNLFWVELGTNDYGLNAYASLATFETDLTAFTNAMIGLALPGFKLRLVGPTARLNEATNNGSGWNLPGLRTSISNVVTAVANANVTYVDASGYVSLANRPDAQQLHFSIAGHVEYEAAMRAVVGY